LVNKTGFEVILLLRRSYSKKDIEKVWGGNTMRVLQQVEQLAKKN
jgi:microsomal dipeptidase-like Zn-dependent dipeptidase